MKVTAAHSGFNTDPVFSAYRKAMLT